MVSYRYTIKYDADYIAFPFRVDIIRCQNGEERIIKDEICWTRIGAHLWAKNAIRKLIRKDRKRRKNEGREYVSPRFSEKPPPKT